MRTARRLARAAVVAAVVAGAFWTSGAGVTFADSRWDGQGQTALAAAQPQDSRWDAVPQPTVWTG